MKELSGLQIFKYLPASKKAEHTNCKECGCPTCMAFALKLAKHGIDVEKCNYAPNDLKEIYIQNSKQPQKTVEINGLKIGGENVLYRHEKTFVNRTAIAVVIDCSKPDWKEKFDKVTEFETKRVNEILKIDLIILKNNSEKSQDINIIGYDDFKKLPINIIFDKDFHTTSKDLIDIRQKAVLEKDENYSDPVCVYLEHTENKELLCAKAAFYICKYANMIVFEDFDENMISSLMSLRQNIFTDPQKPLQVEPGIYEFNEPDENSLIFMTTNFALTFFAVASELESLPVSSYLLVAPAEGMSVLTAWSAEKFTAQTAAKTLEKSGLKDRIKHKRIIIPGLLAHMKEELEEEIPDFEIVIGTVNAFEISDFVKNFNLTSR